MSGHDAEPKTAAQLLLDAFEEIKGEPCHPEDQLEALRLSKLPLPPGTIIARMRAVAQRNGPTWRPSRLRYFEHPIKDLLKDQPAPKTPQTTEYLPLTDDEHQAALTHLRSLQTPDQARRVALVQGLTPRASIPELLRLLHDHIDAAEFDRRLAAARKRRGPNATNELLRTRGA